MATIRATEDFISVFECVICAQLLENPKNLPNCGHTYCAKCIDNFPKKPTSKNGPSTISCPECRVVSPIGHQGAAIYQTNLTAQRMVDSMKSQLSAKASAASVAAGGGGAVSFSQSKMLLSKSSRNLQNSPTTQQTGQQTSALMLKSCSHVTKDSLQSSSKAKSSSSSSANVLVFDCPHCNQSFCQHCQIGHLEQMKLEINLTSSKFDQRLAKAGEQSMARTKQIRKFYTDSVEQCSKQIQQSIDDMVEIVTGIVKQKGDELLKELRKEANCQLDGVRKTYDSAMTKRQRLKNQVDQVMERSLFQLTLQEVADVFKMVKLRDEQIKRLEMMNQGHLTCLTFQKNNQDESNRLVHALDQLVKLGNVQVQPISFRFHNPTRLRQAKSCSNVSWSNSKHQRQQQWEEEEASQKDQEADDEDDGFATAVAGLNQIQIPNYHQHHRLHQLSNEPVRCIFLFFYSFV